MPRIEDYRKIIGERNTGSILEVAEKVQGMHIVHINSTYMGGGVAEMLSTLVPLMNDAGMKAGWRILHGNPEFFTLTKRFHNALQGERSFLMSTRKKKLYLETNKRFSKYSHIDHDCVVVHDPQPLPLINYYQKKQPWIWRCHIDLSTPNMGLWKFMSPIINKYDSSIFSRKEYVKKGLGIPTNREIGSACLAGMGNASVS